MSNNQEDQEEDNDNLDTSWFNEQEQFTNVHYLDGREPMNEIQVKILYIDLNNTLIHTETEICKLEIENEKSIFSREKILLLIQSKNKREMKKYRLSELLLYNVVIEPENLQNYSKTIQQMTDEIYLKKHSTIDDIQIASSILIFHTINTVYFIFQEIDMLKEGMKKTKKLEIKGIGFFTKKKRDKLTTNGL